MIQDNQNYKNIYNSLKEYMFYPEFIHNNIKNYKCQYKKIFNNNNNVCIKKHIDHYDKIDTSSNFFIPQEKDKLFWCLYIFMHSEYEYNIAKNNKNIFSIEKKWKIDSLTKLKEKNIINVLKSNKIKISEIEDELMNKDKITLKGLIALCIIHNLSIMYISNNKYYELLSNDNDKLFIIINTKNNDYAIVRNTDNNYIKNIRDSYFKIDNINKPLKSLNSYSLNELQTICNKMNISLENSETKKKKTMKILYQELLSCF